MTDTNNFMGKGNFVWFNGVVEDRADPEYLGRVRVRALSFHTQDKEELPTEDLPWSQVILPITSAGISGLGVSPSFLVVGSWVVGYFRDGEMAQEPVVFGTIPGFNTVTALEKNEAEWPLDKFPGPDTHPYARWELFTDEKWQERHPEEFEALKVHPYYTRDIETAVSHLGNINIPTADFDSSVNADASSISASDSDTWSQISNVYNKDGFHYPQYPYNKVYASEKHILEFDDTPTYERIKLRHSAGTYMEIDKDANKTDIIAGHNFTITSKDNKSHIKGKSDITIDGRHKLFINKSGETNNNYDIQIGPNANINIQVDKGNIQLVTKEGNINVNSAGDYNMKVGGNYNLLVSGNKQEDIFGSKVSNTSGAVTHRGSTIDLNP